jgi:hypothetical protein
MQGLPMSAEKVSGVFGSTSFQFAEVARLGLCKVALPKNQGIAGGLAQARVGGQHDLRSSFRVACGP